MIRTVGELKKLIAEIPTNRDEESLNACDVADGSLVKIVNIDLIVSDTIAMSIDIRGRKE